MLRCDRWHEFWCRERRWCLLQSCPVDFLLQRTKLMTHHSTGSSFRFRDASTDAHNLLSLSSSHKSHKTARVNVTVLPRHQSLIVRQASISRTSSFHPLQICIVQCGLNHTVRKRWYAHAGMGNRLGRMEDAHNQCMLAWCPFQWWLAFGKCYITVFNSNEMIPQVAADIRYQAFVQTRYQPIITGYSIIERFIFSLTFTVLQ